MTLQRRVRQRSRRRQGGRLVTDAQGVAETAPAHDERGPERYATAPPAMRFAGSDRLATVPGRAGAISTAGTGEPHTATPGFATSTRLQGRTDADFAGSTFEVTDATTRPAKGCKGCGADACKRVTGEVVMTFTVATTVTLPTPDPDLTPCQLARVRKAIRDILAPHEQQHVAAFQTYDGSLTRKFDLTMCEEHFDAAIRAMFDKVEKPRRARAQARSDALDKPPFFFDVDLDCQEPPKQGQRSSGNPIDESPEAERPT
jgi:hypothetical protein